VLVEGTEVVVDPRARGQRHARDGRHPRHLRAFGQEGGPTGGPIAQLQRGDQLLGVAFDPELDPDRPARLRLAERRLDQPQPAPGRAPGRIEGGLLLPARPDELRLRPQLERPLEEGLRSEHVPLSGGDPAAQQVRLGQQLAAVVRLAQQPIEDAGGVLKLSAREKRPREAQRLCPARGRDQPLPLLRFLGGDARSELAEELLGLPLHPAGRRLAQQRLVVVKGAPPELAAPLRLPALPVALSQVEQDLGQPGEGVRLLELGDRVGILPEVVRGVAPPEGRLCLIALRGARRWRGLALHRLRNGRNRSERNERNHRSGDRQRCARHAQTEYTSPVVDGITPCEARCRKRTVPRQSVRDRAFA
jgi:hypothetical protein